MQILILCALVACLFGCSNGGVTGIEVPCVIDQPAPYVDGIPYLGIHANAQNSDIVDCDTAPAYQEAWHVLKGKGIPQPVTFSPDGETVYATSTNAEEDGCRVWALDGRTGETNWCETYDRDVAASSVEVDLDGHLYFTAARRVISLNADGTERWSTPLEEGSLEVDVVVEAFGVHFTPDGHVATITAAGVVFLLDRATGAVLDSLDLPEAFGFVPLTSLGSGFDLVTGLPQSVKDDATAIFGSIDEFQNVLETFLGAGGGFNDNTIAIAPDGTLYAVGGGPDPTRGSLMQIKVQGTAAAPELVAGWHLVTVGGSATSPSISANGRFVHVSDGASAAGLIDPSTSTSKNVVVDIAACDANADGDADEAVCTALWTEPLEKGAAAGSPGIFDDGSILFWEVSFNFAAIPPGVRDLVWKGPEGLVWDTVFPDDLEWTSVATTSRNHVFGTASVFTEAQGGESLAGLVPLPSTAASELLVIDRDDGGIVFRAPITDDATSTVAIGPKGSLYTALYGLISILSVDQRPTLGLVKFAPTEAP
ncbi:MAG: PQQ-binding-like beta-propeller repeat protein [Deltaproteobacteria bacterium]|nr:PQQ-binding-like beta-propeller repeat protein [Deltaproteobacteria bacterium]